MSRRLLITILKAAVFFPDKPSSRRLEALKLKMSVIPPVVEFYHTYTCANLQWLGFSYAFTGVKEVFLKVKFCKVVRIH